MNINLKRNKGNDIINKKKRIYIIKNINNNIKRVIRMIK